MLTKPSAAPLGAHNRAHTGLYYNLSQALLLVEQAATSLGVAIMLMGHGDHR